MTGTHYTPHSWARELLSELGVPVTSANMRAVIAWEAAEGGHWANAARFNPLNTDLAEPGSYPINSVGVQAYVSWKQGLSATVSTLREPRYTAIMRALSDGHSAVAVERAVVHSRWGTKSIGNVKAPKQASDAHTSDATLHVQTAGLSLNPLNSVVKPLETLLNWIIHPARLGEFLLGFLLIVGGIMFLFRRQVGAVARDAAIGAAL